MKNIKLGVAITVNKEIRTIRSLKNRIQIYKKYRDFHKLQNNLQIIQLLKKLQNIHSILTSPSSCYILPTYNLIRLETNKLPNIEDLWTEKTHLPWIALGAKKDQLLKIRMETLRTVKIKARIKEQKWRLTQQMLESVSQNHFIIFNTLTIEPKHYTKIFLKNSKSFRNYINYFDRISKDHTYFMVREAGELSGRLHVHCIHILKIIPDSWKKDPNDYTLIPTNREIWEAKKAWPYGFSSPIAVRFNTQDAFSLLGWRWPIQDNKPLSPTNPRQLTNYIAKYLTKTLNIKEKTIWKTKIKRNLGLKAIQKSMKILKDEELEMLATLTTGTLITTMNQTIPKGILIKEATRELLQRQKKLPWKKRLWNLLEITPAPSIIEQWKRSTQILMKSNSANTTTFMTKTLNGTECYKTKAIKEKILKSVKCIYDPTNIPYAKHITPSHRNPLNY